MSSAVRAVFARRGDRLWFVLGVALTFALLAFDLDYIRSYASTIPILDDAAICLESYMPGPPRAVWLWALHNEHRLPLPKLIQTLAYKASWDIRSGMLIEAGLYAVAALACLVAARRLRGAARPWDWAFALLWQQRGNCENLLMGFQICIALPTLCLCAILFLLGLPGTRTTPRRAALAGACSIALPLCGGTGLLTAPFAGLYLAYVAWRARRDGERAVRAAAWVLAISAALTAALCGLYMVGYEQESGNVYSHDPRDVLRTALGFLGVAFGSALTDWHPNLGLGVLVAVAVAGWASLRRLLSSRGEDLFAAGALSVLLAGVVLALFIGYGRPAGAEVMLANRYVPLAIPAVVAAVLGALGTLPGRSRELLGVAAALTALAAWPRNEAFAKEYGDQRRQQSQRIEHMVARGDSAEEVIQAYTAHLMHGPIEHNAELFQAWWRRGLPPFDARSSSVEPNYALPGLISAPVEIAQVAAGSQALDSRWFDGQAFVCLAPGTSLAFAVAPEHRRFSARFAVPAPIVEAGMAPQIRVRLERRFEDQTSAVLYERVLDPASSVEDRGLQSLQVELNAGPPSRLWLTSDGLGTTEDQRAIEWCLLRETKLE